jgi:hypothetical protein
MISERATQAAEMRPMREATGEPEPDFTVTDAELIPPGKRPIDRR